ncbi:cytochrome o ubiquinol oxidase subunit IV [Paenibacillus aurantius]|uniref:Cytochrome o ubiquinol oxidase subunit IV n=1 Tax=Paenibacillus aurantius TaxID=2918900 RepID=A0AA96LDQ6_9BACL|nr:cytochrome o ubiquinol oxidase subunit IV [Paenibacillus aurantius]WJH36071.1 cytochrome o ubiquinol oxidase subunit IV [Paenibacillus sp. CC-CFT747]WNQ11348.1 cytochrome o ubiquinol oxidase subunit IV [Paenibacillus aurantius]
MAQPTQGHDAHGHEAHGSLKQYVIGFLLSIVLTIIPIVLVMNHVFEKTATIVIIMVLAVMQFLIQLVFFMHLREGEKPRYNVMALILGVFIVFVIVAGSMWIMGFNSMVQ